MSRAVNQAGGEVGLALHYDRTSVSHWLSGTRPPEPVPSLVAEVLSRALGRQVTAADTGLLNGNAPVATRQSDDLGLSLVRLARPPTKELADSSVYTTLLELDAAEGNFAIPLAPSVPHAREAEPTSVPATELMLPVFARIDTAFGGGAARQALSSYLAVDITPRLVLRMPPGRRDRFLRTASRLTYLAGYMHFDDNMNGIGQSYYQTALRMAAASADLRTYTTVLRAMSIQALHLGHRSLALDIAEAAARHNTDLPPGQAVLLTSQWALTLAANGQRRKAFAELRRAEQTFARGPLSTGTIDDFHAAAFAHQSAETFAYAGEPARAIRELTSSLRQRPADERRARALINARLGGLQLDQGHLEQACAAWHLFLDDQAHLRSGRIASALAEMRSRLRPFRQQPVAREVLNRSHSSAFASGAPPAGSP
ncbi:tol-pal system YbgF family protein [Streptomyces sp. NPDC008317]|uniref:tetratricopeptide repeat protein n=1 Tax=Streptomyces sp. NPDC008317 TaxID=3364827 RepID=UPI0036E5E28C